MEKKDLLKFSFDYSVCPMYSILHLFHCFLCDSWPAFSVFLVSLGNIPTNVCFNVSKKGQTGELSQ